LRWDDQQSLRAALQKSIGASGLTDYGRRYGLRAEYAKSGKSTCRGCQQFIDKSLLRLSFSVEGPYGPVPAWHHVDCFFPEHRAKCASAKDFSGWKQLEPADQQLLEQKMIQQQQSSMQLPGDENTPGDGAVEQGSSSSKRHQQAEDRRLQTQLRAQSQAFWAVKDQLKTCLMDYSVKHRRQILQEALEANQIRLADDAHESDMLDVLADAITFGRGELCSECQQSRLIWQQDNLAYTCPHYTGTFASHDDRSSKTYVRSLG
jgi:poly [ADP-ribose] polymerase